MARHSGYRSRGSAALKLHGTYIGHLRHLKPRQKAQVKAIKAKKGYGAAITMARRLCRG